MLSGHSEFIMTRYTQMLTLYLAFVGLTFRAVFEATDLTVAIAWGTLVTVLNGLAFYGARSFKSMADHSLNRQALLADELGMQRPHPLIWGYYVGLVGFTAAQLIAIGYLITKILNMS